MTTNTGMISGIVVRVEEKKTSFPAAIVTVAGETYRDGKALVFFEQVRLRDRPATAALQLQPGEAVLFDTAYVEQLTWTDQATQDPRAQIVIRAHTFARLSQGSVQTRLVGEQRILLNAMNHFVLRGRLVRDVKVKHTKNGPVAEANLAMTLGEGDRARTHYFQAEAWHVLSGVIAHGRQGDLVITEVLVKTDTSVIDGERRYFTKLESRAVSCLARSHA